MNEAGTPIDGAANAERLLHGHGNELHGDCEGCWLLGHIRAERADLKRLRAALVEIRRQAKAATSLKPWEHFRRIAELADGALGKEGT